MNERDALERIAKYPMSRSEEMSVETAREIAREALASQAQQPDWLLKSTQDLATHLWKKHYKSESPVFEVLNDLAGVISQIDNMTTGLVRLQSQAQQSQWIAGTPTTDHFVDVWVKSTRNPDYGRRATNMSFANGKWQGGHLHYYEYVSHYMPLPPAPEGGDK